MALNSNGEVGCGGFQTTIKSEVLKAPLPTCILLLAIPIVFFKCAERHFKNYNGLNCLLDIAVPQPDEFGFEETFARRVRKVCITAPTSGAGLRKTGTNWAITLCFIHAMGIFSNG